MSNPAKNDLLLVVSPVLNLKNTLILHFLMCYRCLQMFLKMTEISESDIAVV